MEFVDATEGLREYKGQVVPRNTGRSPWIHQFDLNITHTIYIGEKHTLDLIFNIENVGNLINSEWVRERRPLGANGGNVRLLEATHITLPSPIYGNEYGYYQYNVNERLLNPQSWYDVRNFSSRWAMQVGFRYSF